MGQRINRKREGETGKEFAGNRKGAEKKGVWRCLKLAKTVLIKIMT